LNNNGILVFECPSRIVEDVKIYISAIRAMYGPLHETIFFKKHRRAYA
jgi:hypothetical protein